METNKLILGDCILEMQKLPDNSVDAVICDPPYGLEFMGKEWDKFQEPKGNLWRKNKEEDFVRLKNPNSESARGGYAGMLNNPNKYLAGKPFQDFTFQWATEVYRVLKYGGHLLAFGGTRTYHRMACAIEDAGFEIRDMIEWIYGSGFPKSLNIGKQIDKMQGNEREVVGKHQFPDGTFQRPTARAGIYSDIKGQAIETKGTSLFEGYGTALKPSHEPIVLARKPLSEKNVALNCLKWGTGGINVDGCRIETDELTGRNNKVGSNIYGNGKGFPPISVEGNSLGRFPANLIHDGSDEVIKEFPMVEDEDDEHIPSKQKTLFGDIIEKQLINASRFFYVAKAGKEERNLGCDELPYSINSNGDKWSDIDRRDGKIPVVRKNHHPTVKPITLMEYLIKLITPPNKDAVVMDCFMGSGTTGCACAKLGIKFIGIEKEEEYFKIADSRIKCYLEQTKLTEVLQ